MYVRLLYLIFTRLCSWRTGTTWRQFLHTQAATMLATDFFHVD